MLKFIRKKMTAMTVNSFMRRVYLVDSLHKSGRMPEGEYRVQLQKILMDYQEYIFDVPDEFIPAYAKAFFGELS